MSNLAQPIHEFDPEYITAKDPAYWIASPPRSGATSEKVAINGPKGDPWSMSEQFNPFGDEAYSPFGVPADRNDATSGTYIVTVTYNHGAPATCSFYVEGQG